MGNQETADGGNQSSPTPADLRAELANGRRQARIASGPVEGGLSMRFHGPIWRAAVTDPDLKSALPTADLPNRQPRALPHRTAETGLELVSLRSEGGESVITVLGEASASGEPTRLSASARAVAARRDALEAGDLGLCFASPWSASADAKGQRYG